MPKRENFETCSSDCSRGELYQEVRIEDGEFIAMVKIASIIFIVLGVLMFGSAYAVECWKHQFVAESNSEIAQANEPVINISYIVQYKACVKAGPDEVGRCSCYARRNPIARYWVVNRTADGRIGKDTDLEQVISRRYLNRLEGTLCNSKKEEKKAEKSSNAKP